MISLEPESPFQWRISTPRFDSIRLNREIEFALGDQSLGYFVEYRLSSAFTLAAEILNA